MKAKHLLGCIERKQKAKDEYEKKTEQEKQMGQTCTRRPEIWASGYHWALG